MLRKLATLAFSGFLAALSLGQQSYSHQSVTIHIGQLLLYSSSSGATTSYYDWDPNLLLNLSQDTLIKPPSWALMNPAPGYNSTLGGPDTNPKDYQYWEVNLDTMSDAEIANYDVLVVAAHGLVTMNPLEISRLKRFMDKGGVLWVDLAATSTNTVSGSPDYYNGFPLPFKFGAGSPPFFADYIYPVLNYPNAISYIDLTSMPGPSPAANGIAPITTSDLTPAPELAEDVPGDSQRLQTIIGGYGNEMLSVGQEGDGFEVVSCYDIADTINNATSGTPLDSVESAIKLAVNIIALGGQYSSDGGGARKSGTNFSDAQAPLLQEWNDNGNNTSLGYAPNGNYGVNSVASYKGFVVASQNTSGGSSQIIVYDGHPSEDVTGQGQSDNTTPLSPGSFLDYSLGAPYDEVWAQTLSGPISPPTCIEVPLPGPGGTPVATDEVWVVDSTGNLHGYILLSPDPSKPPGTSLGTITAPTTGGAIQNDTAPDGQGPYAPTYSDGLLFVADQNSGTTPYAGQVWIADPASGAVLQSNATGAEPWSAGGTGSIFAEVSGSATVGYIPNPDGSGSALRMVYVPSYPNVPSLVGPMITGLELGVRGESPASYSVSAGSLMITTKAGAPIFVPDPSDTDPVVLSMGPKLTIIDGTSGEPLSQSQMESLFGSDQEPSTTAGTGVLTYNISGTIPANDSLRVDYSLDWGQPNPIAYTPALMKAQITLPLSAGQNNRILDHIALGPTGSLYAVVSSQDASGATSNTNGGGDYYELQQNDAGGNNGFNVLVRWTLHDQFSMSVPPGLTSPNTTVLPAVSNEDPLVQLFPALLGSSSPDYAGQMQYLTFTSAPVVSGNVVYCTAQGSTNGANPIPDAILFAFKANPPVPTIEVSNYNSTGQNSFTQPDLTQSTDKAVPEISSTVSASQNLASSPVTADQDSTDGNWKIRFNNLYQSSTNCISLSEPILYNNGLISPDQVPGSHWSPLSWYTVFTGCQTTLSGAIATGAPYVSNDTIYVPLLSNQLSLIINGTTATNPPAMVYGINDNIAGNDAYFVADQNPWLNQLVELGAPTGSALTVGNITFNPDFTWPHLADLSTASGNRASLLAYRLAQSELTVSDVPATQIYGIAGGNGRLFALSNQGLFGFEKADYVIADNGRVSDFDSVGDPIWSTDQSLSTGDADISQVGNVHGLVTPTRAYPLNNGQTFIVDSGGNRISVVDQTGHELRSISGFSLDSGYTPDGYSAGETTKFNTPRDLAGFTQVVPNAVVTTNPFTNPAPTGSEYWVCYVVADTGNKRLVELVDRYNYSNGSVGAPIALGQLYWHTPAALSGGANSYTCVTFGTAVTGTTESTFMAAGLGNVGTPSSQTQGGGIVVFPAGPVQPNNPALTTTTQPYLISTFGLPGITGELYTEGSSDVNGAFGASSAAIPNQAIGALNSLTSKYIGGSSGVSTLMFTNSAGVFELSNSSITTNAWGLNWMLPRSLPLTTGGSAPVYSVMRQSSGLPNTSDPLDFRPTYAQRLASGNVVVVNGYTGRYRKANVGDPTVQFQGEVLEIDPTAFGLTKANLGFVEDPFNGGNAILYQVPPVAGARGIVTPVFATRR